MRRYWVSKESIQGSLVTFKDDVFHHIFDVCRQDVGSHFEVLCGDQNAYLVEVTQVAKKSAQGKITETRKIPEIQKPHIHLALSVSRFNVMDAVVEKAVEMGVLILHPYFSDYSFIKKDLPQAKIDRWNKIILSATQQCGRGELMKIEPAINLDELLKIFNQSPGHLGLFAYEGEARQDIQSYLRGFKAAHPKDPIENIWIFIGSEGGFSSQEVQKFQDLRLESVTLGDQVLRVETACIALISVLKYEFGLMK